MGMSQSKYSTEMEIGMMGREVAVRLKGFHSRGSIAKCLAQVDTSCVGPKAFQIVEGPALFVEQVDYDPAVIECDPATFVVAGHTHPRLTTLFQVAIDFFSDSMQLSTARTCDDHEAIEDARLFGKIEDYNVLAFIFGCNVGCDFCTFDTVIESLP